MIWSYFVESSAKSVLYRLANFSRLLYAFDSWSVALAASSAACLMRMNALIRSSIVTVPSEIAAFSCSSEARISPNALATFSMSGTRRPSSSSNLVKSEYILLPPSMEFIKSASSLAYCITPTFVASSANSFVYILENLLRLLNVELRTSASDLTLCVILSVFDDVFSASCPNSDTNPTPLFKASIQELTNVILSLYDSVSAVSKSSEDIAVRRVVL